MSRGVAAIGRPYVPAPLAAARALARSSETATDKDIAAACEVLEREGDWFDRTRAAELRQGIAARSTLGRNAPAFASANSARRARPRLPAWLLPGLLWTAVALGIGAAMAGKALPQAAQDTLRHDLREGA